MNNLKTIWIYIFFLKIQQIDINYTSILICFMLSESEIILWFQSSIFQI